MENVKLVGAFLSIFLVVGCSDERKYVDTASSFDEQQFRTYVSDLFVCASVAGVIASHSSSKAYKEQAGAYLVTSLGLTYARVCPGNDRDILATLCHKTGGKADLGLILCSEYNDSAREYEELCKESYSRYFNMYVNPMSKQKAEMLTRVMSLQSDEENAHKVN
ncbi:hypothetical protein [Thalassolituus sp. UBA1505]|uniref:hypothetical protein n=1 Tax=Thalassolituus sp. UBA1505 TaxID=1947653 RepID=UPI0025F2ACF4|nr:hypothetical protein [Thalassolituus sp. UBA1505]